MAAQMRPVKRASCGGHAQGKGRFMATIALKVNEKNYVVEVEPRTLLVELLREQPAAHRHPRRLRHQPVRRLHRHGRRQVGEELHHARRRGRRRRGHHHRGPGARTASCTRCRQAFHELPRPPVRLLHAGHGHERRRPAQAQRRPDRARGPRVARGQHLPLHRLPQHRQGGARPRAETMQGGCRDERRRDRETIGASVARKEDRASSLGTGRYTDDIDLPGPDLRRLRALAARARQDPLDRHRRGARGARRASPSSPARTSPPTSSAASPAAGSSRARTARTWSSRRTRRSSRTRCATSATRSPS